MDKEIPFSGQPKETSPWTPTPEDQRKFELASELIKARAKLEVIEAQVSSWKAQEELTKQKIKAMEDELHDLKKGQLVLL